MGRKALVDWSKVKKVEYDGREWMVEDVYLKKDAVHRRVCAHRGQNQFLSIETRYVKAIL